MATLKYYHIWIEGYEMLEGEHGTAKCLTEHPIAASTFNLAVKEFANENPQLNIKRLTPTMFASKEAFKNKVSSWTLWDRRLYPSKAEAIKEHG